MTLNYAGHALFPERLSLVGRPADKPDVCLQISAGAGDTVIGRAFSLHCQLHLSAVVTAVELIHVVILPSLHGRGHFGVMLVSDGAAYSHAGGTPAEWGGLDWGEGSAGELGGKVHSVSKLGSECSCWYLQVSRYLSWGLEDREMVLASSVVLAEVS